nr:Retrovirus-related Pol polyprotein from transposon 17.6 [Ipomoea batatas]
MKPFLLLLADDPDDGSANSATFEACDKDIDAECDDTVAEPVREISLHALEGTQGPRTFRLAANIKGRNFTILIDTDNSHNYIQPRLANYLHLVVDNTTSFPVAVGNGERI